MERLFGYLIAQTVNAATNKTSVFKAISFIILVFMLV